MKSKNYKIEYSKNLKNTKRLILIIIINSTIMLSCKKFLEIGAPKNSLVQETVFQNDDQAISAITGIYSSMANASSYASGGLNSITCYAGLSSDELIGYGSLLPFYENQISPESSNIALLYSGMYKSIYSANSVLEGLAISTKVNPLLKTQLNGEALFVRAFAFFYLVNIFGDIPLQLTSDYRITSLAYKTPTSDVYKQILLDLELSEILLTDNYPSTGRVRPNKSTVEALLARTYLYLKDWKNAEKYSSDVISKSSIYKFEKFDDVFLANSQEAIWQLMPAQGTNAPDANLFIPGILTAPPISVSLRNSFVTDDFEVSDQRLEHWVKSYTVGTETFYYPFKYKNNSSTTATEYSTVFRLAEQFLIRAEARINQDKIDLGISDLNIVRTRPLNELIVGNNIPTLSEDLSKSDALLAVEHERKIELFSEWGHRWFDLKRSGRADIILNIIKPKWQPTDIIYPIPQTEISRNTRITQNDGY